MQACRPLARHDRGPRGRTNGASRVAIGEAHTVRREAINVWRFMELTAVAAEVSPTHVVDDDQNDIRAYGRLRHRRCHEQQRNEKQRWEPPFHRRISW